MSHLREFQQMIVAKNINKAFGELRVLDGVTLHIRRGSIFGLAGRSGAGKSTLLRCMNGLETYDGGTLLVNGVEINQLGKDQLRAFRRNVGMVFQNFSLLERLTVYENVALPLRCWKEKRTLIERKVKELLGLVGLSQKAEQKPRTLSGGQKQRVAIARALSLDPHILLCDEATSALDPKTAQDILSLLRSINNRIGITIVMVTHQMSVLKSSCDEMAILEQGKVADSGPVGEIFDQPPSALRNLMGEDRMTIPTDPQSVLLRIHAGNDLAAQMAMDLGIEVTIAGSRSEEPGLHLRLSASDYDIAAGYLNDQKMVWQIIDPLRAVSPPIN